MKKILLSIFIAIALNIQSQTLYTVDNSPNSGADFTSVQAAIDAANSGDTLFIHPSATPYGNFNISKVIHIRSLGHSPQYTQGMSAELGNISLTANPGANGITLSGLRFGEISVVSNSYTFNNLQITNCWFNKIIGGTGSGAGTRDNWVIAGCVLQGNGFNLISKVNGNGWLIVNNYLRNPSDNWSWNTFRNLNGTDTFRNNIIVTNQNGSGGDTEIRLFETCVNLNIENSIFLFMGNAVSIYQSGNSVTYNNCLSYNYGTSTLSALTGNNNLNNTNPNFVNIGNNPNFSVDKNFNIQPGSPASGHGIDGQDIGLFGNSYIYNMYGNAAELPYISKMQILNNVVAPGGTLNVHIEATGN
jgi:hypothetical protein